MSKQKDAIEDTEGMKHPDDGSPAERSSMSKITLRPRNQPIVPKGNNKWVSVEVINKEQSDLTDCHGFLERVTRILDDGYTQEEVLGIPIQLAWSSRSVRLQGLATIFRGT